MKKILVVVVAVICVLCIASISVAAEVTNTEESMEGLQSKIDNLQTVLDRITLSGNVYVQYDWQKIGDSSPDNHGNNTGTSLDLLLGIKINDDCKAYIRTLGKHAVIDSNTDLYTNNTTQIYITSNVYNTTVSMGLIPFETPDNKLIAKTNLSGVQWTFGKAFQTVVTIGRLPKAIPSWYVDSSDSAASYRGIQFRYAPLKNMTFLGAYHDVLYGGDDQGIAELGFNTKLSKDFGLKVFAVQSDVNNVGDDNKAYVTNLTYKVADPMKVGSYDIFLGYTRFPLYTQIATNQGWVLDKEQIKIGFDYILMKNMKLTVFYADQTVLDNYKTLTAGEKVKCFRTKLTVYF